MVIDKKVSNLYECWLKHQVNVKDHAIVKFCKEVKVDKVSLEDAVIASGTEELMSMIKDSFNIQPEIVQSTRNLHIELEIKPQIVKVLDGFEIQVNEGKVSIIANNNKGLLYGIFRVISHMRREIPLAQYKQKDNPQNKFRMINEWDNIENSIFYKNHEITKDLAQIKDYARLLSSVGINGIAINTASVHQYETEFTTEKYLRPIAKIANVFRSYGIKLYLSINFTAPIEVGDLKTADPLNQSVRTWWKRTTELIYKFIPDLGGFLVKADSETRQGLFTYNRNHAEIANVVAEALGPFGGVVIWRGSDWIEKNRDRAMANYEAFKLLDGQFKDNVILQIKGGPMDFQIKESISPLFGAMKKTNQIIEFEAAEEYAWEQKQICFLVPMWKEALSFNTYAKAEDEKGEDIVSRKAFKRSYGGVALVSTMGDSSSWTGSPLAAANLYGFGRLAWNLDLTVEEIVEEWTALTLDTNEEVVKFKLKE